MRSENETLAMLMNHQHYSQLAKHSYFQQSYTDLHARPFPVAKAPLRVSQLCFLHDKAQPEATSRAEELAHLTALSSRYSVNPPLAGASCFYQCIGEYEIRWERHTEFSSYSFLIHERGPSPFQCPPVALVPVDWLDKIPGKIIAAVHIDALDAKDISLERDSLRQYFEGQRLIGAEIVSAQATILTALRLHKDNFNRILLVNSSLNECQSGRVLRALLEIEAYRNMTLLAFPLAQQVSSRVSAMESALANILNQQNHGQVASDEKARLAQLSKIAADVAELIASSRYRFDAGCAYYQMVQSRFAELQEQEIAELQTLNAFIDRRLSPAYRTVLAAKRRLDDLSSRVDRASDFIRTRIDMAIEAQNQALLQSMDRRAQMQFNLQQTVEGVSVVVMTFYVLALADYVLTALDDMVLPLHKSLILAGMLPLVLLSIWLLSRGVKKQINGG
ncbi:Uncharacterized membrane-anchored protein [Colwellia chukchiensis]|uniref:Uncharacterized membrane-anchored protein n=1 Tax=Colwellia chukchiensis TaxID=641665 RepID=A0A1H7G7L5_9GAMM|nr:DUF3422 domain-containing protein [Colwellia chukchiensis]SEK34131.1 Uncharacterized membrane-anchored protein [Colwellia chukchiensis]